MVNEAGRTRNGNSLRAPEVARVLDRLHEAARGDKWRFAMKAPKILASLLSGKSLAQTMQGDMLRDVYIPVSREQGEFLYITARAIGAKRIVEFGTSFGISTIYLAAAIHDNAGEAVIGSELEPSKHKVACANLAEAGLASCADVRLGDALETLATVPAPIDMVLLDGWKDLYLPLLKLLTPKLRAKAVVLADNIHTFKKSLRPYVVYVQSGHSGFQSTTLSISDGFEYSIYEGEILDNLVETREDSGAGSPA